jgi:hypothetical protein
MNSWKTRKVLLACILLLFTCTFAFGAALAEEKAADQTPPAQAAPAPPEAPKPSLSLSTDVLNQYIFRGAAQTLSHGVIQPSVTASYNGFSLNYWGNVDMGRGSTNLTTMPLPPGQSGRLRYTETDFTASYTKELFKNFSVLIGNVYYDLQVPVSGFNQDEIFGGVSYNFPWVTVAFTAYGEVTHFADVWLQLDITKSIPVDCILKGATVDLGASFGYLTLMHTDNTLNLAGTKTGNFSGFDTCQLTADIKFPLNDYITITPKVGYWLPLTSAAEDLLQATSMDGKSCHFVGGLNLNVLFF